MKSRILLANGKFADFASYNKAKKVIIDSPKKPSRPEAGAVDLDLDGDDDDSVSGLGGETDLGDLDLSDVTIENVEMKDLPPKQESKTLGGDVVESADKPSKVRRSSKNK